MRTHGSTFTHTDEKQGDPLTSNSIAGHQGAPLRGGFTIEAERLYSHPHRIRVPRRRCAADYIRSGELKA